MGGRARPTPPPVAVATIWARRLPVAHETAPCPQGRSCRRSQDNRQRRHSGRLRDRRPCRCRESPPDPSTSMQGSLQIYPARRGQVVLKSARSSPDGQRRRSRRPPGRVARPSAPSGPVNPGVTSHLHRVATKTTLRWDPLPKTRPPPWLFRGASQKSPEFRPPRLSIGIGMV
jgi:hypothetical protein